MIQAGAAGGLLAAVLTAFLPPSRPRRPRAAAAAAAAGATRL